MSSAGSSSVKIVLIFAVALSMLSLPSVISNRLEFPAIRSTWAIPAPCPTHGSTGVCSDYWLPAGAAMDTEQAVISTDITAQLTCLSANPPCLDLTDSPVPPNGPLPPNDPCSSSTIYCTASVGLGPFAYLSNWARVVNDENVAIPNFFTWLDAHSFTPTVLGTVRQGFSQVTFSVNPYIANTAHDFYIVGNIYDSLTAQNPLNAGQLLDWMVISSSSSPLSNSHLGYSPPAGTVGTFRFTLRGDLFFQDGRRVTAFDVAFSYLSLKASGAYQSVGASPMTGITVRSQTQFDINLNSTGPFVKANLGSLTILPGRYWTGAGPTAWDMSLSNCSQSLSCYPAQYTLGPTPPSGTAPAQCSITCIFPAGNMNADPSKISASYDPLSSGILIGSGPWECLSSTGVIGALCSSTGKENPPPGGFYNLTRFGSGVIPGSAISSDYFRSNGNLALWAWSGDNGDFTHDFVNLTFMDHCYGQPAQPLGATSGCGHFQQGIGAGGGPTIVGVVQIGIVARFLGVNWVSPFDWQTNPPTGIDPFPPVLYVDTLTLNPASIASCIQPYPTGGYDC
jgi:hypothetical protein